MELTYGDDHLYIKDGDIDLFKIIKSKKIPLDIHINGYTEDNVLEDKDLEKCKDITKLSKIKGQLKTVNKVKRIVIVLE